MGSVFKIPFSGSPALGPVLITCLPVVLKPFVLRLSRISLVLLVYFPARSGRPTPLFLLGKSSEPVKVLGLPTLAESTALGLLLLLIACSPALSVSVGKFIQVSLGIVIYNV